MRIPPLDFPGARDAQRQYLREGVMETGCCKAPLAPELVLESLHEHISIEPRRSDDHQGSVNALPDHAAISGSPMRSFSNRRICFNAFERCR